jgi:hypothetical protein
MKARLILLLLLLAHGPVSAAMVLMPTNELDSARSQATNSLVAFRDLISSSNYQLLGFHSTNEVLLATNAEPVPIYSAGLGKLRSYVPGQSLDTLLEPNPQQVIIPVMVGTNVRTSITLRFQSGAPSPAGAWTTANWGQPQLIRELIGTVGSIPPAEVQSGTAPFAVELPVLDLWLVGYVNGQGKLVLRATVDMPLGPVTIHRHEILTEQAMYRLAIAAQRYNGLPN